MSGLSSDYLDRAWRELEEREAKESWAAIRLPESPVERELLLALDENKGRHLLVPAGSGRYPVDTQSPLSVDISVQKFLFSSGDIVEGRFVDVSCRVPKLNEQFDGVVESVLESVVNAVDPARRAIATVNSWRRLFSTMASAKPLSLNEKYAVFAELVVLDQLELYKEEFSEEWWTGPQSAEHDFELPDISLEIKAIGLSSRAISIHGATQLSETDEKPLYLIVVGLEESAEGQTVGSLLDSIAERSSDGERIRMKAASQGVFLDVEDTTKLRVTQVGVVRVGGDFPRLEFNEFSKATREALGGIQYELLLTAIRPRLAFIELKELMVAIEE